MKINYFYAMQWNKINAVTHNQIAKLNYTRANELVLNLVFYSTLKILILIRKIPNEVKFSSLKYETNINPVVLIHINHKWLIKS